VPRGRAQQVLLDSLLSALNCQDLVALEMVSASGLTDLKAPFQRPPFQRWHWLGKAPGISQTQLFCGWKL
jgi:hypothetical protein